MKQICAPFLICLFAACSHVSRPCQEGFLEGQEPREIPKEEKIEGKTPKRWPGNKRCDQKKEPESQRWLNHGPYIEWYPDGKRAIEGEYKMGLRHGKWMEYDPSGKMISERWFESGAEVPKRGEVAPVNGFIPTRKN